MNKKMGRNFFFSLLSNSLSIFCQVNCVLGSGDYLLPALSWSFLFGNRHENTELSSNNEMSDKEGRSHS